MHKFNSYRRLLLLLCLLSVFASRSSAQAETPKQTSIRLPAKYETARALAQFITSQVGNSSFELALSHPPTLDAIVKYLPTGTVATGNTLILPNGTLVTIVKANTEKEYQAEFAALTYTREELIKQLRNLPKMVSKLQGEIVVKVKRPDSKEWVTVGAIDRAVEVAKTLPVGTYVAAELTDAPNQKNKKAQKVIVKFPKLI